MLYNEYNQKVRSMIFGYGLQQDTAHSKPINVNSVLSPFEIRELVLKIHLDSLCNRMGLISPPLWVVKIHSRPITGGPHTIMKLFVMLRHCRQFLASSWISHGNCCKVLLSLLSQLLGRLTYIQFIARTNEAINKIFGFAIYIVFQYILFSITGVSKCPSSRCLL